MASSSSSSFSSAGPNSATYLSKPISLFFFLVFLSAMVDSHPCSGAFESFIRNRNITQQCQKLDTIGAEIGWNYRNVSSKIQIVDVIFAAPMNAKKGWLAWGVNPGRAQMIGTNAIIGIKYPNGTLNCDTYNLTRDTKLGCEISPTPISEVKNMRFEYVSSIDYHAIFANLVVSNETFNVSAMNMVWQIGFEIEGDRPKNHPVTLENMDSTDIVNLATGKSYTFRHKKIHLTKMHGILNIVGFGVLLPLGAITARYFRHRPVKCKSWMGIHVTSQIIGTILGFSGWVIGIWLGSVSKNYTFPIHRSLGIAIFTLAGAQLLSLRWKPKELDEYRRYWNMYHHFMGYVLLVVIAVNIFRGINILRPYHMQWKAAYIGIIVGMCLVVLAMEIFFGFAFFYHKQEKTEPENSDVTQSQEGRDDSDKSVIEAQSQP